MTRAQCQTLADAWRDRMAGEDPGDGDAATLRRCAEELLLIEAGVLRVFMRADVKGSDVGPDEG